MKIDEDTTHRAIIFANIILKVHQIRQDTTCSRPRRCSWIDNLVDRQGIKSQFGPLDVGITVTGPVRDHGPCDPGSVAIPSFTSSPIAMMISCGLSALIPEDSWVKEEYPQFIATNGRSLQATQSDSTNFAFLVRLELTRPEENTTAYGMSIARLVMSIGGKRPVIQRLGDLHRGWRSTEERIARNR